MCSSRGRKRDESDRVPNAPRAVAVISLLQAARKWSICRRVLSVGFAALRPGVIYSFCPRSVSCRINFGLAWWKPLADWFHAHPYVRGPRASLRQIRSGLEKALLLLLLLLSEQQYNMRKDTQIAGNVFVSASRGNFLPFWEG